MADSNIAADRPATTETEERLKGPAEAADLTFPTSEPMIFRHVWLARLSGDPHHLGAGPIDLRAAEAAEIGRTLGKSLGEFRRATNELKRSIEQEVRAEEVKTPPQPSTTTTDSSSDP